VFTLSEKKKLTERQIQNFCIECDESFVNFHVMKFCSSLILSHQTFMSCRIIKATCVSSSVCFVTIQNVCGYQNPPSSASNRMI
jgi:hypothetical protein